MICALGRHSALTFSKRTGTLLACALDPSSGSVIRVSGVTWMTWETLMGYLYTGNVASEGEQDEGSLDFGLLTEVFTAAERCVIAVRNIA